MTLGQTMMTYSALWTLADIIEQKMISKKDKMDLTKTVRMVTVGTFVIAPFVSGWIIISEKLFPGRSTKSVLKKIFTGQTVFAPMAITSFYFSAGILEGKNRKEIQGEWSQKFKQTYTKNLMIWPAAQFFNFSYVPYAHRTKVMGVVSFLWSIFLCYLKEDESYLENEKNDNL